jgi:Arc/MetJ-type ribon-helix-helix transcriptional regulator
MISEYKSRIAFRLSKTERQQIEKLIEEGKFKSVSQLVRVALQEFLEQK